MNPSKTWQIGLLAFLDVYEWRYSQLVESQFSPAVVFRVHYQSAVKRLLFGPDRWKTLLNRIRSRRAAKELTSRQATSERQTMLVGSAEHRNYHALSKYYPAPYSGDVHLFRCYQDTSPFRGPDPYLGWKALANQVVLIDIEGLHETVLEQPAVQDLGPKLVALLDERDERLTAAAEESAAKEPREFTPLLAFNT